MEETAAMRPSALRGEQDGEGWQPGDQLGRFTVLGVLGRGGMGVVLAAYDPDLDRRVALKLVRKTIARRGAAKARLRREAQAMARLQHPNVLGVFEVGEVSGQMYLAMEYVDGMTLGDRLRELRRQSPPPWQEIVRLFVEAGRGLDAAHRAGLVHRDFKVDNVLVSSDGRIQVTDFGLAGVAHRPATEQTDHEQTDHEQTDHEQTDHEQTDHGETEHGEAEHGEAEHGEAEQSEAEPTEQTDDAPAGSSSPSIASGKAGTRRRRPSTLDIELTQPGEVMGTPSYMAPEQHEQLPTDARSDQFAFCAALYRALYGQLPFAGRNRDEYRENKLAGKLRPAPRGTTVPTWVFDALARGLERTPADRYSSMEELLADFNPEREVSTTVRGRIWATAALGATWGLMAVGLYLHDIYIGPATHLKQGYLDGATLLGLFAVLFGFRRTIIHNHFGLGILGLALLVLAAHVLLLLVAVTRGMDIVTAGLVRELFWFLAAGSATLLLERQMWPSAIALFVTVVVSALWPQTRYAMMAFGLFALTANFVLLRGPRRTATTSALASPRRITGRDPG